MKRFLVHFAAIFIALILIVPAYSLEEGAMAPLLRLKDKSCKTFDSGVVLKKKPIVVSFFMIPCAPCLKEIPFLQSLKDQYSSVEFILVCPVKDLNLKTITLDEGIDFIKSIEATSKKTIDIRVVYDKFFTAIKQFNVKEYPTTFLIGKDGKVLLRIVGFKDENGEALENMIKSLGETKK